MNKLDILHNSKPLINAILEHPDLPMVFMTNTHEELDYPYVYSSEMYISITHILTCDIPRKDSRKVFDDWDEVQDIITSWYNQEYHGNRTLEEMLALHKEYWKEVILVRFE